MINLSHRSVGDGAHTATGDLTIRYAWNGTQYEYGDVVVRRVLTGSSESGASAQGQRRAMRP